MAEYYMKGTDGSEGIIRRLRDASRPLESSADLDPLIERIGDARFVLLGEASHGTGEYYRWRARISRRLIAEKGFSFVAVEGDWPDCYRVNRYVKEDSGTGGDARSVLQAFERWPTWMWANWEVAAFIEWLRRFNRDRERKAGFYGLDVYSLWESLEAITGYLERTDPEAAEAARRAFACFEPYGEDEQAYAWSTASLVPSSCEREVIDLLAETRRKVKTEPGDPEDDFSAEQNALVAVDAEEYYRTMIRGGGDSWNVRDLHMMKTLDRLMSYHGEHAKGIVWAHNTHVGDARATTMAAAGMFNIGQLARERHGGGHQTILVGFGGHRGSVIAGRSWGARMERMNLPRSPEGSWEDILHRAGERNKLLFMDDVADREEFYRQRGHRAIGVVYHPERERGNYVPTVLPERYDAFLSIDSTEALHPLHLEPHGDKPPDTYPWGF